MKTHLSLGEVRALATAMAGRIVRPSGRPHAYVYGVPRGGIPVAFILSTVVPSVIPVDKPDDADFIVDDLIDSGRTVAKWNSLYPGKPFHALIDKRKEPQYGWVVFPWEASEQSADDSIIGTLVNRIKSMGRSYAANDNVADVFESDDERTVWREEVKRRSQALLDSLLIDTQRDHNTEGTASRMAKMFCGEVFIGRTTEPPKLTTFPNAKGFDEMLVSGPIPIRSTCSHHFCPILGKAWIGMIPGERVIGLSKFNRVVDWFASRPQIQEELVVQIADYIEKALVPKGLAVVIEASHTCMTWRGVKAPTDSVMATNVMRGRFRSNDATRAEFLAMIRR